MESIISDFLHFPHEYSASQLSAQARLNGLNALGHPSRLKAWQPSVVQNGPRLKRLKGVAQKP